MHWGLAVVGWLGCSLAAAQVLVAPTDRVKFNDIFDNAKGSALKCQFMKANPFVDFSFRFELTYVFACDISQFEGKPGELQTFVRIRTSNGGEMFLRDRFFLPGIPVKTDAPVNLKKMHSAFEFSGAVAAGEGEYEMELVAFDQHNKAFRHHWKIKAFRHGSAEKVELAIAPGKLEAMGHPIIPAATSNGPRLTIFLNAAPIFTRSLKLRAWDRAFLLTSLSTMLRELSYSSVRLVAFNLDQQREIFRQDNFSAKNLRELAESLRKLELGKVSYSTLESRRGWEKLLVDMTKAEAAAPTPSDAIVFLGPRIRLDGKVEPELITAINPLPSNVFCVSYFPFQGNDFPDSVQRFAVSLRGRVFRVHSPGELAHNLEKIRNEIAQNMQAKRVSQ